MPNYHLHLINAHVEADDVEGHDHPDRGGVLRSIPFAEAFTIKGL